jgi:hypothetical protein
VPLGAACGGDARGGDRGDLLRSWSQLLAEKALLRQQVLVLRRGVKSPALTPADCAVLVLLARRVRAWPQFFDGLTSRTEEIKARCRTKLQALAASAVAAAAQEALGANQGVLTCASV